MVWRLGRGLTPGRGWSVSRFSSWRWPSCAAAGALLLEAVALVAYGGTAGMPTSTRNSAASPAASGSSGAAPVRAGTARTLAFVKGEMRERHAAVLSWSSDGRQIVFGAHEGLWAWTAPIYTVRVDGFGARRVPHANGFDPAFMPQ
jgi:hypothetical protein